MSKSIKDMSLIEVWNRADELRPEYYEAKTAIEKNVDLNMDARNRQLTELKDATNEELQTLKAAWMSGKETRKDEICKRAFGIGHKLNATEADRQTKQMNYRAALERAERAEKRDDLKGLLEQADVTGDDLLKKAVGLEARKKGFNDILSGIMDEDDFKELTALDQSGSFTSDNTHFTRVN